MIVIVIQDRIIDSDAVAVFGCVTGNGKLRPGAMNQLGADYVRGILTGSLSCTNTEIVTKKKQNKLRGLSPRANYTGREEVSANFCG
jgi:hypothetical protein